ncbi:hypothetical protein [Peptoniphilus sp. EMRHCC_23]|uniref:hypothetical protein n=1 Tax=Peptoniphilus rachelemmaiella TaxID=2811779 RepID=UPI001C00724D|nr:hypothetical protein [Peptoniphilus rachelemmaiella]
MVDHHFGTTSEGISYYPKGDDLDGTNSWSIQTEVSAIAKSAEFIEADDSADDTNQ